MGSGLTLLLADGGRCLLFISAVFSNTEGCNLPSSWTANSHSAGVGRCTFGPLLGVTSLGFLTFACNPRCCFFLEGAASELGTGSGEIAAENSRLTVALLPTQLGRTSLLLLPTGSATTGSRARVERLGVVVLELMLLLGCLGSILV